MAAPKKQAVSKGKTPAKGGQKAVVTPPVKNTAASAKKPPVGVQKPSAATPKRMQPVVSTKKATRGKGGGYGK